MLIEYINQLTYERGKDYRMLMPEPIIGLLEKYRASQTIQEEEDSNDDADSDNPIIIKRRKIDESD